MAGDRDDAGTDQISEAFAQAHRPVLYRVMPVVEGMYDDYLVSWTLIGVSAGYPSHKARTKEYPTARSTSSAIPVGSPVQGVPS